MLFGHIFAPPPGWGGQTEKYTPLREMEIEVKNKEWEDLSSPPSPLSGHLRKELCKFFLTRYILYKIEIGNIEKFGLSL